MHPPSQTKAAAGGWLSHYAPPKNSYDEFLGEDNLPRPHWKQIAASFQAIGDTSWEKRRLQLDRLVRDNGVTFNVYSEGGERQRAWSLDMLPMVMSPEEAAEIESALAQRATLLNIILGDVYGRQTLLQTARMHPHLIYANPSFLRPCHGLLKTRDRHLHVYAADLTRGADGNWWVLGDNVQSAGGLGYALENRMLMSRIYPKIMWESEIQSLQPFINAFTTHIESLAPGNSNSPNVALLTQGPNDPSFFEHSYLARNLGYTLAEGADLIVRNNQLFMKTIGGVQRIEVLLRRVASDMTDPLELRNESLMGVPGLVNAVRQGNLSVVNGLGSGFVETTAMLAFLPWFCRNYLGENLEMPSVATWWCGQKREREHVIANIDKLAVKPTFWTPGTQTYFGPSMSSAEKAELIRRIEHRPENYCGQQILSAATVPVDANGRLESRHFKMRVFLISTPTGWKMMPGGLIRYAANENDFVISLKIGGASKDVWIPRAADQKKTRHNLIPNASPNVPRRSHAELPSRTAENLFWLGRYLERAEGLARVLRSICNLLVEEAGGEIQQAAMPFLRQILPPDTDLKSFINPKTGDLILEKAEAAILRATLEEDNIESLIADFAAIRSAALKVKERLSTDTWDRITELDHIFAAAKMHSYSIFDDRIIDLLDSTLDALASFIGNLMENTVRSQGWNFLEIGRRIERGVSITFMLEAAFHDELHNDEYVLSKLLEWADSSITYRRRYLNTMLNSAILDVLCFDVSNPRSLSFQTEQLHELVKKLPHANTSSRHPIDQTCLRLYSQVGLGDPYELADVNAYEGKPTQLLEFLEQIRTELFQLAAELEEHYFAHTNQAIEQKPKMNIG